MRVKELVEAMEDCLFQVEKYNKETDEYEVICIPFEPIPPVIGEKKVITASPSIGFDGYGKEHTVIDMQI